MTVRILSSTALAAWAAATSKTGQLTGLRDEWADQMYVRCYSAAHVHLATVVHATPVVDTGTWELVPGAYVSQTVWTPGTAAYCICQVPAGADILRCDVALAGAISDPGGRVRLDIGTTLRVQATASLPAGAAPGTVTTIGTQTLFDYLEDVYTALPEGFAAAEARMQGRINVLAYCGATIWRGKLAFPIFGGHGDSFDDGGYAIDLTTGEWETLILPTEDGTSSTTIDGYGEWTGGTAGRPASQHTLQYLVTVGDDMVQAIGCFIGVAADGRRQAHRWKYATGLWERYGGDNSEGGVSPAGGAFAHYDAARNRIVRIEYTQVNGKIDYIAADNPAASWTGLTVTAGNRIGTSSSAQIGYHAGLDCYVLIDPLTFADRRTIYVMDPDDLASGFFSAPSVSGDIPPLKGETGLEYCPPLGAMVTVDATANNKLFYITPTGGMTDPWVWSSETFTGATETWDGAPSGLYNGVYGRFKWSSALGGFVMLKKSTALTELYVPTT